MDSVIPFKSREVKHCPPHFIMVPVEIPKSTGLQIALDNGSDTPQKRIRDWCHETIAGRFFVGKQTRQAAGFMIESFIVAFELEADATYFTLLKQSFIETE